MEENELTALQTQSQQRNNKAYYSSSPLGEGLGVRPVEGWGEAGSRVEGKASCC